MGEMQLDSEGSEQRPPTQCSSLASAVGRPQDTSPVINPGQNTYFDLIKNSDLASNCRNYKSQGSKLNDTSRKKWDKSRRKGQSPEQPVLSLPQVSVMNNKRLF